MQLRKDYSHSNKYLGNKCDTKKIISVSFRNTEGERGENKTSSENQSFYNDYKNVTKEPVNIFQIFQ